MIPFGVKAGVGKKDDKAVLRGRVFSLDVGDILANCRDKAHLRYPSRANDALKYSELLGLMLEKGSLAREIGPPEEMPFRMRQ